EPQAVATIRSQLSCEDIYHVRCPVCGRVPMAATAFAPVGALRSALAHQDGLLFAAIGWTLKKRRLPFESSMKLLDSELDFLVRPRTQHGVLVECKMHQILSKPSAARETLLKTRSQLRDHIKLAEKTGTCVVRAASVVNLRRKHLAEVLAGVSPERDPDFART